jgi:demethylmenaquinone methyltransferase / 2-methoxy-6-polyprenyl-1,4-benzoquinol methylase
VRNGPVLGASARWPGYRGAYVIPLTAIPHIPSPFSLLYLCTPMETATVEQKKVVTPYGRTDAGKKQQVAEMFNNIAHRYDLLNRSLSMGIDVLWRKKMIAQLKAIRPKVILDVATGTGDVALEAMSLKPDRIVGLDISVGMLDLGKQKIAKRGLSDTIEMVVGDSENLPFDDSTFDAITVAFGVRNFEDLGKGLGEMHRVLNKGGKLVVLEFSQPRSFPIKQLYWFYFNNILPFFGKMLSKDASAYTYLPESVKVFPDGERFLEEMKKAGFKAVQCKPLTFGIASIYTGVRS